MDLANQPHSELLSKMSSIPFCKLFDYTGYCQSRVQTVARAQAQAHVATVGRRGCLGCLGWGYADGACLLHCSACSVCLTVWLFGLPVASILNCYALDNLNTRRRKNKTRTAKGEEGKAANAIADRLLDQCGRLGSCN